MAIQAHVDWLKEGVKRWNKRRKRVDFSPDLSGIRFFDFLPKDFRDDPKTSRTFEKINLSGANLESCDLSDLNFRGANFSHANLTNAEMSLSNFNGTKFENAKLVGVTVTGSRFNGALFVQTQLDGSAFSEAVMKNATFVDIDPTPSVSTMLIAKGAAIFSDVFAYRNREQGSSLAVQSPLEMVVGQVRSSAAEQDDRTRKTKYDVMFGTNRNPIVEREAIVDFGGDTNGAMRYGICEVIVPESHQVGSLGSPLFKRLLNKKDDRLRIEELVSLDEALFSKHLRDSAETMRNKHVPIIFVHGYNSTFTQSVLRAAQIGYDLGIGQGVGLFSWPSKGKKRGYFADEESVEDSKDQLADFIHLFVESSITKSVNIVGHSMGCRCVLGALNVLSVKKPEILERVDQVVLAAADVNARLMPKLAQATLQSSNRTTSYVSNKDKALGLSAFALRYHRVGLTPPTFVMNGMDTVWVNNKELGNFSHGYLGSSRAVLSDLYNILKNNLDPENRHSLVQQPDGCWKFKE